MNRFTALARTAFISTALLGATAAIADTIPLSLMSNLVATDPLQNGRLSRNGVPQDVSGTELYPGLLAGSSALSYHFHVYSINVGATSFVNIFTDSTSTTVFVAAYQSAYYKTNFATSWLGDGGTSGNAFGTDPISFAVHAAPFSTLLLVVNESTPNGGLGAANPFTIFAQGATMSDFSDAIDLAITSGGQVIPEPSTLLLLAPLALVAGLRSRRRRAVAVAA